MERTLLANVVVRDAHAAVAGRPERAGALAPTLFKAPGVNDERIDGLLVAVYTPASEKPKTARVLTLRRGDRGAKPVVVALPKGREGLSKSDLAPSFVLEENYH